MINKQGSRSDFRQFVNSNVVRRCLHDTESSFIPVRLRHGSIPSISVFLHDNQLESHSGITKSVPQVSRKVGWNMCRTEMKLNPASCKHYPIEIEGDEQEAIKVLGMHWGLLLYKISFFML